MFGESCQLQTARPTCLLVRVTNQLSTTNECMQSAILECVENCSRAVDNEFMWSHDICKKEKCIIEERATITKSSFVACKVDQLVHEALHHSGEWGTRVPLHQAQRKQRVGTGNSLPLQSC